MFIIRTCLMAHLQGGFLGPGEPKLQQLQWWTFSVHLWTGSHQSHHPQEIWNFMRTKFLFQHCLSCFTQTERLWWRENQMLKLFLQGLPKYILELPPDMRTTWVIPLTDTVFTVFTLHSIPPHSIHSIHSTHSIHRVWIFSRRLPPPASPAAPQIQKIIHLSHLWLSLANL